MKIKSSLVLIASVALLFVNGSTAVAQPPAYTFVDIGSLGGNYSYPYAVNNSGQVAVYSQTSSGQYHAALYSNGVLTDLTPGAGQSFPEFKRGLNDAGHVYGRVQSSINSGCYVAFLHYQGITRTLSTGGCDTYIQKMNASGQVIGSGTNGSGQQVGFVYTPTGAGGTMTIISFGGTNSYAYDINDSGVAVGYASLPNGTYHAFRHNTATGTTTDVGTLGGVYSIATAINAAGQVSGWSYSSAGYQRAVRWLANGTIQDMGTLGGLWSSADKIDAAGRVYGQSQLTNGNSRSFRSDGTAVAIDPADTTNGYALLVNSNGAAAGYYYTTSSSNNQPYVFNGTAAFGLTSINYGYPNDLSDSGYAAGYYYPTSTSSYSGFLFSPLTNSFLTLGNNSYLEAVNESGWAVGWAQFPSVGQRGVLTNGTSTYDVQTLVVEPAGAQLNEARHISDTGYIAGYGYWNNSSRAYLLAPGTADDDAPATTASAEPLPNGAGWANQNVTVTLTAADETDGSGVKEIVYSATGAGALAQTVASGASATMVVSVEGTTTVTYFARDNAGNEETPKTLTVRVDKTAPAYTCASADGSWHGSNVSLTCTAEDTMSGLVNATDASFSLTTSIAADAESANAATDSRIVCDAAGNCATAGPIAGNKIDRKKPGITLTSPTATSYALMQSVAAAFTCGDTGSGPGTCSGPVADGADIDAATAGAKTFTVTATDAVGNSATASVSYTVLKGTSSVTWAAPAPIVYGTALGAAQLNASSLVAGTFVYTPAAGAVFGAGTHPLSVTFTPADIANYDPAVVSRSIDVTPAALVVTVNNATKLYGAANPGFSATIGGLVNSDLENSLGGTLGYTTAATTSSAVGTYPVTASGLSSPNYTVSYTPGTLTVTPRALVVTAHNAAKVYGAPMPSLSAGYAGFVNGDDPGDLSGTLGFATAATAASSVGSYPVTPQGLTATNYSLSFVAGALSVTPAALVITADGKSMVLNGVLPAFTASYAGLVNGDTPAALDVPVSLSSSATGGAPGSFPIAAGGAADANYTVSHVNGSLTVGYLAAGNCLAGPGRVILQPINTDGTSVFKKGSTVPAKFRVCDVTGAAVSAATTVTDFRLIQTQTGTMASVNEPVESTTPFNEFRWDSSGQQWIFNMNTKNLGANTTYTYRVSLADGTWLDFRFGLK